VVVGGQARVREQCSDLSENQPIAVDLVRVDRNGRRTTLVRNAGEFADWNL